MFLIYCTILKKKNHMYWNFLVICNFLQSTQTFFMLQVIFNYINNHFTLISSGKPAAYPFDGGRSVLNLFIKWSIFIGGCLFSTCLSWKSDLAWWSIIIPENWYKSLFSFSLLVRIMISINFKMILTFFFYAYEVDKLL